MPRGDQLARQWRLLQFLGRPQGLWHPSQELRELPGGRLEVRLRVADTLEVRRWLQGFGAEVEVLAPPSLRQAIRDEAGRLLLALAPARKPLAGTAAVKARSARRAMEWGGLVGSAVYEGDLAPFLPYLVLGQWTHVGSGTTFGLGRYQLELEGASRMARP